MRPTAALLAGFALAAAARAAPPLRTVHELPLALANEIAAAAVTACAAEERAVTATVVDRAGQVKAVQRADGAGPHTLDSSRRKAYTAVSMKQPTSALLETSQKYESAQNLGAIDGLLLIAGGVPIFAGDEVIGAVGIAGAGAAGGQAVQLDEQCAETALDKLELKPN